MTGNRFHVSKRQAAAGVIFGIAAALMFLAGGMLEREGYLHAPGGGELAAFAARGAVLSFASCLLLQLAKGKREEAPDAGELQKNAVRLWGLLVLVHLVFLLSVYPGFFVYDASEELAMVQSRQFTTHHPLLHVLVMGGVIQAVHKVTGSYNAGIFVYSLLQVTVIDAVFAFIFARLSMEGAVKGVRRFAVIFFAVCPPVVLFTLCTCKDGIFAAALLVLTVMLRDLIASPQAFLKSKAGAAALVVSAAVMMLFRHNGVYAYLVFAAVFAVYAVFRKMKRAVVIILLPLVMYGLVNTGLTAVTHATSEESQEILTVPIQQLARTYLSSGEDFSKEEKELMLSLMEERDWERYNPKLSDQVKVRFDNAVYRNNRSAFFTMWLRQGRLHPASYLNAWLMTSYGFWYPDAVIDCYRGNTVYTLTYGDSSYFGYETEKPGERRSLIPALDRAFRTLSLEAWPQKTPVLHLILAPGAVFLCWLFCILGILLRGEKARRSGLSGVLPYLPVMLTFLTVLLGPCALPRYVVYLWFGLPLVIHDLS